MDLSNTGSQNKNRRGSEGVRYCKKSHLGKKSIIGGGSGGVRSKLQYREGFEKNDSILNIEGFVLDNKNRLMHSNGYGKLKAAHLEHSFIYLAKIGKVHVRNRGSKFQCWATGIKMRFLCSDCCENVPRHIFKPNNNHYYLRL